VGSLGQWAVCHLHLAICWAHIASDEAKTRGCIPYAHMSYGKCHKCIGSQNASTTSFLLRCVPGQTHAPQCLLPPASCSLDPGLVVVMLLVLHLLWW